jgi:hypothetical protein
MNRKNGIVILLLLVSVFSFTSNNVCVYADDTNSKTSVQDPIVAMFILGDIYPSPKSNPEKVVQTVVESKLNVPILSLFHVNCSEETAPNAGSPKGSHDADIAFNDVVIIRDGKYIGDPSWPDTIRSLRKGNVHEIHASFGGYGVPDFKRIGALIDKYGTGKDSPLYKNLLLLKELLGIDGIDLDNEDYYNVETTVKFSRMLLDMELDVTFCPYRRQSFWRECVNELGTENVKWINLQCYAGGKRNTPSDWADIGVPLVAGVCADCCCRPTKCSAEEVQTLFTLWTTGKGSVSNNCWAGRVKEPVELIGGFIWEYNKVANDFDKYVNAIAAGLKKE